MKLKSIFLFLIVVTINVCSDDIQHSITFKQPEETVSAFEAVTINLLKMSIAESKSQRFIYAKDKIKNLFDFKTIGTLILGKHLESENKDLEFEFIKELQNLTARTMVLNYVNYSKQNYKTLKIKKNKEKAFVFTEFYISDNETVPFKFILKNNQGNWQIINIIASGVSDLSVKKIEYQSFLKTKTLSKLIDEIKRKNQI